MADKTMPVTEVHDTETDEVVQYECAFHILPTVADEEVSAVVDTLKARITKAGGTITTEEAPQRFDLAYDITVKNAGANKTFNASHFGWVRFSLVPAGIPALDVEIGQIELIFRHIVVRLTREDELEPFYFFASRAQKEAKEKRDDEDEEEEEKGVVIDAVDADAE